jgi:hypothetical protein
MNKQATQRVQPQQVAGIPCKRSIGQSIDQVQRIHQTRVDGAIDIASVFIQGAAAAMAAEAGRVRVLDVEQGLCERWFVCRTGRRGIDWRHGGFLWWSASPH